MKPTYDKAGLARRCVGRVICFGSQMTVRTKYRILGPKHTDLKSHSDVFSMFPMNRRDIAYTLLLCDWVNAANGSTSPRNQGPVFTIGI